MENIKLLIEDAGMLAKAAADGKLATRADAAKHHGEYKKIVQGVNDTLDAVIGPLNVAAEYVDRISKGDIPPKITDSYNGDFNEIKNNLNACIDTMSGLLAETDKLVKATVAGQLATRGDAAKFAGGWGTAGRRRQQPVRRLRRADQRHGRVCGPDQQGRHPAEDHRQLQRRFQRDQEQPQRLHRHDERAAGGNGQAGQGDGGRSAGDARRRGEVRGRLGQMVGGVNNLCDAFVGPINVTAEYVDRISKGDIPPKITDTYNGDFNEIKNNLNACIDTMSGLLAETDKLVKATVDGQLATRGDAAKFAGGWGKLVGGVNNLCDAFVGPINVTAEYVDRISQGRHPAEDHRQLQRRLQRDQEQPQRLHRHDERAAGGDGQADQGDGGRQAGDARRCGASSPAAGASWSAA